MADVFISYKREERVRVQRIASALEQKGLSVWFDASLEAGDTFSSQINREARAAKAVVVCWTPAASHSPWVIGEADIGRERQVLAPVFLESTELPPPFNALHSFDLTNWDGDDREEQWVALLDRIGTLVGREDLRSRARTFGGVIPRPGDQASSHPADGVARASAERLGWSLRRFVVFAAKTFVVAVCGAAAFAVMRRWSLLLLSPLAYFIQATTIVMNVLLEANDRYHDYICADGSVADVRCDGVERAIIDWGNVGIDVAQAIVSGGVVCAVAFFLVGLVPKSVREGLVAGVLRR